MIEEISFSTKEEAKRSLEIIRDNGVVEDKKAEVVEMIIEAVANGVLRGSFSGETPLYGTIGLAGWVIVNSIDSYSRIERVFEERWRTGDRSFGRLVGFDRVNEEFKRRWSKGDTSFLCLWDSVLYYSPEEVAKVHHRSSVVLGGAATKAV